MFYSKRVRVSLLLKHHAYNTEETTQYNTDESMKNIL